MGLAWKGTWLIVLMEVDAGWSSLVLMMALEYVVGTSQCLVWQS